MPLFLTLSTRNLMLDLVTAAIDAAPEPGSIAIYQGDIPGDPFEAVDRPILALLFFSQPSFRPASRGSAVANPISNGVVLNPGTARWARIRDGGGNPIFDCDVGTADATIILDTVSLGGGIIVLSSFTLHGP